MFYQPIGCFEQNRNFLTSAWCFECLSVNRIGCYNLLSIIKARKRIEMKITLEKLRKDIESEMSHINAMGMDENLSLMDNGLNSVDIIDVALIVETKYGIRIVDMKIAQTSSIRELIDYCNSLSK
jgi:acyl carrier protein